MILLSTSSAVAPGHSIETDIVSTSKFGKNCLFSLLIDKKPASNIKNIIIFAAVLCLTKKVRIED
jgi:hypothetical protein